MERLLLLLEHKGNRRLLEEWLAKTYRVVSPHGEQPLEERFDLAILDGPTLTQRHREVKARRKVEEPVLLPFLLLTPRQNSNLAVRHLGQTVDELILTPIEKVELQARVANLLRMRKLSLELERQHRLVEKLSITDDVSGFHNTRFLHQYLDTLLERSDAAAHEVSLVFFDMDGFKRVVDTYGHLLGSKVLREVAQLVDRYLDRQDRIVRYGGDEYVVILPDQGKDRALAKVERLKEGLTSTRFLQEENLHVNVTASFGLATFPCDAKTKEELLAEADRYLFTSKARGKIASASEARREVSIHQGILLCRPATPARKEDRLREAA